MSETQNENVEGRVGFQYIQKYLSTSENSAAQVQIFLSILKLYLSRVQVSVSHT